MRKVVFISLLTSTLSVIYAEQTVAEEVQLDPIFVTAKLSDIEPAEAPGSVTVINKLEIEQNGGENIFDLVRSTAGISVQGIGSGGIKTLSLRGLESKHPLILVDGK